jgi:hypothetical protein
MSEPSSNTEWFDQVGGGSLGWWDLAFSLWTVQDFLRVLRAERDRLREAVEQSLLKHNADDIYADRAHSLTFMELACSQAAVGAVAPLAETLLRKVAGRLRGQYSKPTQPNAHHRTHLEDDDFWNPALLARKDGNEPTTNLLGGFRQLLNALGLANKVPDACWSTFEALFAYRNAALHEGYEWPTERRVKLLEEATKRKWDWYEVTTVDGAPWLISVKDEFWPEAIKQIEEVARIMRDACR